jgi:hypothetical protein
MHRFSLWVREFLKLLGGRRLHPLTAECPICRQSVRLHVNKAGRRHLFGHARVLYEGARLGVHHISEVECVGSKAMKYFDPRPGERQRFKLPDSLLHDR